MRRKYGVGYEDANEHPRKDCGRTAEESEYWLASISVAQLKKRLKVQVSAKPKMASTCWRIQDVQYSNLNALKDPPLAFRPLSMPAAAPALLESFEGYTQRHSCMVERISLARRVRGKTSIAKWNSPADGPRMDSTSLLLSDNILGLSFTFKCARRFRQHQNAVANNKPKVVKPRIPPTRVPIVKETALELLDEELVPAELGWRIRK